MENDCKTRWESLNKVTEVICLVKIVNAESIYAVSYTDKCVSKNNKTKKKKKKSTYLFDHVEYFSKSRFIYSISLHTVQ